ncbi:ribose 5-phosphate isomerase B [Candidatus Dependentiae bacterium]|nr:ribose 5-phosphate isomerase B [Candidatus Dependentiae bacterium]
MKISIGSDHRGFDLKNKIIKNFRNIKWFDFGTNSKERTDYPIYAKKVCKSILSQESEKGILICGSGIGMAITANRFSNIYAALCWNEEVVKVARQDDKANILVIPSDFLQDKEVYQMINVWLHTEFKGGHYQKRLEMIDK